MAGASRPPTFRADFNASAPAGVRWFLRLPAKQRSNKSFCVLFDDLASLFYRNVVFTCDQYVSVGSPWSDYNSCLPSAESVYWPKRGLRQII
jgi:hypothetical protein